MVVPTRHILYENLQIVEYITKKQMYLIFGKQEYIKNGKYRCINFHKVILLRFSLL